MNRPWSLTRRLVLWYGCSLVLLVLGGNLFQYWLLDGTFKFDRSAILSDRLSAISTLLQQKDGREELNERVLKEWPTRGGEKVFVRLFDGNHDELLRTPGFPVDLLTDSQEATRTPEEVRRAVRHVNAEGQSMLTRAQIYENNQGWTNPVYVYALIGDDQSHGFLARYRQVAMWMVILSVVLSLVIGRQIARQGTAPLAQMTDSVSHIHSETLHERLSVTGLPVELHKLAGAFNQTLDKLQDSFERLSRFSSDIAHELRTPVSNMLGEIEVTLNRARTTAEYEETLASTLEECGRLRQIIESLLFLARAENLDTAIQMKRIDTVHELRSFVEFFEPSAAAAGLEIGFQSEGSDILPTLGEQTLFQRAIGNLLSNAIRYTPAGGRIQVICARHGDKIRIQVKDSGPGIAPEHLKHVFDRFYRVDSTRNLATGGVGLGLAIVKSIVDLHKGHIEIVSDGSGTRMILDWPAWREGMPALA